MPREIPVETLTVKRLKAQREVRSPYVFRLTEAQLEAARDAGLPDSALLAMAAIAGAAYGARGETWVSLSSRVIDSYGKGYRWWHRATDRLERAGFLECQRQPGRTPRYRLCKNGVSGSPGSIGGT